MGRNNINFNLLSLNARGLHTFDRRKAFFNWLAKSSADICFLQETYNTSEVENIWKKQWKGDMFFSHGTGHSKGVLIPVRDHLDFKLQSVKVDSQGRYILLEATIQDSPFLLLNIYAPNKCSEQCDFFKTISEVLKSSFPIWDYSVIVGGDFNVIFDQELDGSGGLKKTKDSVKVLEDICLEHDLLDIWRVRHPKEKRFTWRQKTPIIQRRLDFWLISDVLQDHVVSVDIKLSIKSDHSAITLLINGVDDSERGPSFWKFNSTLVNDSDYRFLLDENIKNWLEEFKEVVDKRVLWDLLKYKIRQLMIKYSKEKAHSRKAKIKDLEEKLQNCTKNCENDPSKENIEELECLQAQHNDLYGYITQGAIIRSRANWYEKGEKNNKYFLNLEKSNKKKSCVRSIVTGDGTITVNPKTIMNELESFYSNLYSEENSGHSSSFLDDVKEFPTLTEEIRNSCEGKIEYNECFKVLQSFQKNKTSGNDGLTIEFYVAFWPLIGKHLFAIPKFMFRASVIPTPKELIEEVNSILYSFIWNGKDKVKRHALISDIEMGGLKMLDIDSMISAKRIICLKKFLEDYRSIWKTILDNLLSPVGGRFVLHCNFHISKLKISLPEYYKECFDAWSDLNGIAPSCYREIINEIIWNNQFLCYDKKSMYRRDTINLGFVKIGDLISEKNSFSYGINSLVNPEQRFFLMSIINSIPAEWRSVVKASTDHDVSVIDPFPNTPTIRMEGDNLVPILDTSSKQIYQLFLQKKQITPTAKQKLNDKHPNTAINWQKVYSLAFQTTLESKIREFQYKILNCIVFTRMRNSVV